MSNFKQFSLIILVFLTCINGFSQKSINFPKEVNSIKMTAPGIAVIATDDALYGLDKDGKELWKNEKLKKVDANKITILQGSELILVQGGFRGGGNQVLNVLNGNIIGNGDITGARVIHGTNQLWSITRLHGIHVWDIASNVEQYTLDKVSVPYGIESKNNFMAAQPITYTGESSAIMHIGSAQLGEYNLKTGKPIWEFDWKPYKVKKPKEGKGDYPCYPSRGYAIMKLDQESNTLYFPFRNMLIAVDSKTGKSKWDVKANKTGQVKDIFVTAEGIVIRTEKGIDLIDKATGTNKWAKSIKVKGTGGLMVNNKGTFYIVSKKSIEKIDIANRKSSTLVDKIKFEGGDYFTGLELINGTVILSGKQNVVGVNKETGKILFSTYHKAPGASLGDIAGNVVLAAVAVAATANSMSVNSQAGNKTYHQYTPAMRNSGGSRTTNIQSSLFMSTKFKGADANGFGIAKVDKSTGKTTKKIVIGVRDPIYVVDENNGIMYYKSEKKSISIKSLN